MDGYNSETSPVLLGVTGDACGSCQSTNVPMYDLSCHESDDFYCRDCLTKMWYASSDEVICCPSCGETCGFMPLASVKQFQGISRDFADNEGIEQLRQQHEVMSNLIAFTAQEAATLLKHAYSLVEDQVLDATALGGLPSQFCNIDSLRASLTTNPFYRNLLREVVAAPKMMTAPLQLEEDLLKSLDADLISYVRVNFPGQILDGRDEEVLFQVFNIPYLKDIRENWAIIISKWVELLTWRHIERTAPVEGGAAERLRKPIIL